MVNTHRNNFVDCCGWLYSRTSFKKGNYKRLNAEIINAFINNKNTPVEFAEAIYQAKLAAKINNLAQIEIFCDLLIGYTYIKLKSYKKAASIIYKIIRSVKNQGMHLLQHLGWLFLGEMNIKQKKFDVAYGMLNNSIIQLERFGKASEFLLLLFKYNMFKVMIYLGDAEKAQICLNQAFYISQKYNLNFQFDTNPQNYILDDVENTEENTEENTVIDEPISQEEGET